MHRGALVIAVIAAVLCAAPARVPSLDSLASEYVKLVEAFGEIDPDAVDGHSRDAGWGATRTALVPSLRARADALRASLTTLTPATVSQRERIHGLAAELESLAARIDHHTGASSPFEEDLERLFGSSEWRGVRGLDAVRAHLLRLLPGTGPGAERLAAYDARFQVGRGQLHAMVLASLDACRRQTLMHVALPTGETVTVEYVAGRPWSGYSTYRGNGRSVLQIVRDIPLTVGQVLNLACHEGYPGHHVYNTLRDEYLVKRHGLIEHSVTPIFGPQGVRSEVQATLAGSLVFSHDERVAIMREALFPIARLDVAEAERYVTVTELVEELNPAIGETLRGYLGGAMDAAQAAAALERDAFMAHPDATLAFADRYRAYSLAYTLGRQLAARAAPQNEEQRWQVVLEMMPAAPHTGGGERLKATTAPR